jgi:hypothetical protein
MTLLKSRRQRKGAHDESQRLQHCF